MPYASLRDFVARLERDHLLQRVAAPVSPDLEITEIHTRLLAEARAGGAVRKRDARRRAGATTCRC